MLRGEQPCDWNMPEERRAEVKQWEEKPHEETEEEGELTEDSKEEGELTEDSKEEGESNEESMEALLSSTLLGCYASHLTVIHVTLLALPWRWKWQVSLEW